MCKIKINIFITFSKIIALIIIILGSIFSFYFKNSEVMIVSFSLSAGLSGLKAWSEGLTTRKNIQNTTPDILEQNITNIK